MSVSRSRFLLRKAVLSTSVAAGAAVAVTAAIPSAQASAGVAADSRPPATVKAHILKARLRAVPVGTRIVPGSVRAFFGADDGFALANGSTDSATYPARTTDGGRTWRVAGPQFHIDAADAAEGVEYVGIASAHTQYAYGSSVVDVTSNAGRTWYEAFLGEQVAAVVPGFNGSLVALVQNSRTGQMKPGPQPVTTTQYVSTDGGRVWRRTTRSFG
jgi:hypothetical protein